MEAAAIAAAVSLVGRLISEAIAAGDYARAEKLRMDAVAEYGEDILPELEKVEAETLGRSELGNIKADPAARNAQMDALARLGEFSAPGMSAEDVGDLRMAQDAAGGVAARAAGQGEQLAAARGLQRSGLSQALAQQGAQAGAQTAADAATQLASARRQRQLQALGQMGQLGGSIRAEDYGQASDAARAQDAINQFNANMNYGARNQRNANRQLGFTNQMTLKNNRNVARTGLGDFYTARGTRNAETGKDITEGLSKTVGSYGKGK
jgi:hypothetical protein